MAGSGAGARQLRAAGVAVRWCVWSAVCVRRGGVKLAVGSSAGAVRGCRVPHQVSPLRLLPTAPRPAGPPSSSCACTAPCWAPPACASCWPPAAATMGTRWGGLWGLWRWGCEWVWWWRQSEEHAACLVTRHKPLHIRPSTACLVYKPHYPAAWQLPSPALPCQTLTVLTNLRKICNHPALYAPGGGEGQEAGGEQQEAEFDPDQSGGCGRGWSHGWV